MSYNLIPCAVCGKLPKLKMSKSGYCSVQCKKHWIVEAFSYEQAVSAWNTRNLTNSR